MLGRGSKVDRRLDQDRADSRDAQHRPARRLPAGLRPTDLPLRGRRIGSDRDRPALRRRPGHHPPPGAVPGPAGRLAAYGRAAVLPSAVLFNGGVFKAAELRRRILDVLSSWAGRPVPELESSDLDLAVAHGAAYYGQVRRGKGVRIRGGVSRSYYVGLETAAPAVPGVPPPIKALCVVPMGMEEGTETDVPGPEIGLIVGEPAEFRFLGSTTRRDDAVGTILERWSPEELQELAPLETALEAADGSRAIRARPAARTRHRGRHARALVPEHPRPRRWKLEFNVREASDE